MSYAIPHEYEEDVYRKSTMGIPYREIAKWLADSHRIAASYMAVSSCVKRVRKQKEEVDAELFAPEPAPSTPLQKLERLDHSFAMIARKAWRLNDCEAALKAQICQLRIASKQLDYELTMAKLNGRSGYVGDVPDIPEDADWATNPPPARAVPAVPSPVPPEPEPPRLGSNEFEELEEEEQLKADERPDHFPIDPLRLEDPRAWFVKHGLAPETHDKIMADLLEEMRVRGEEFEDDSEENDDDELDVNVAGSRGLTPDKTPDKTRDKTPDRPSEEHNSRRNLVQKRGEKNSTGGGG